LNKAFAIISVIALSLSLIMTSDSAMAATQKKKKTSKSSKSSKSRRSSSRTSSYSGPETGLVGIKLYDSGLRVVQTYGNPDSITAINVGGGSAAPGGGGGGGNGGFGGRGGGTGGGGASEPSSGLEYQPLRIPSEVMNDGIDYLQASPDGGEGGKRTPSGGTPAGGPPGGGRGGAGAPGGAGGASESAEFVRWNYTKNGTKLSFVIDKFNRVIQIEAIGLTNPRVKTRRGVGFGSTFSTIMKGYGATIEPDGYDISGNNFVVRFLTRQRVAFRLTRLSGKQAHVVTGIVVAAGKQ
jgi:hypothetical protein